MKASYLISYTSNTTDKYIMLNHPQAGSCLDVHYVAHVFFWVACLLVWLGIGGCKSLSCQWHSASARQLALHGLTVALIVGAVQSTLLDVLTRVH